MKSVTASAPGKLVLAGEYAVLHGYPAIAAALSRRARVAVLATGGDDIVCETRGYRPGSWPLRAGRDGELVADDEAPLAMLQQVLETVGAVLPAGTRLLLDTSEFATEDGRKFGIGSSAALTVALTAALAADSNPGVLGALARNAHRAQQQGGSGVDVACALHGGVILFRDGKMRAERDSLPAGLHCQVLWSGQPASTAEHVARLARDLQRPKTRASLTALGRVAESLERIFAADAAAFVDGIAAWTAALERFDNDCGLGIFAGGFAALATHARKQGLVFKPCGAGGGDVGALLATDPERMVDFVERAQRSGFTVLEAGLGAPGADRNGEMIC